MHSTKSVFTVPEKLYNEISEIHVITKDGSYEESTINKLIKDMWIKKSQSTKFLSILVTISS